MRAGERDGPSPTAAPPEGIWCDDGRALGDSGRETVVSTQAGHCHTHFSWLKDGSTGRTGILNRVRQAKTRG